MLGCALRASSVGAPESNNQASEDKRKDSDYAPDASDNEQADYEQENIISATREKGLG